MSATQIAPSEPLHVAVLGWVTAFKGAARVLGSARIAANERLPLHIQVIGTIDGEAPAGLDVTGPYQVNSTCTGCSIGFAHICFGTRRRYRRPIRIS